MLFVGIRRVHATNSVNPKISIGLCRGCCIGQMLVLICSSSVAFSR